MFGDGRLCLYAIQKNYNPTMTLIDILLVKSNLTQSLENCIYDDNIASAANGDLTVMKVKGQSLPLKDNPYHQ